jgi:hypothetical protein
VVKNEFEPSQQPKRSKDKAEIMRAMRERRRNSGLKEVTFWVNNDQYQAMMKIYRPE